MTRPSDGEFLTPGPQVRPSATQPPAAIWPHEQQRVTVTLPNEVDVSNESQVHDMLARAVRRGAAVIVADATGTTYCGCAGVRVLIRTHQQATAAGARLLVAASPAVRRILKITGADQILDTCPSLADGSSPEGPAHGVADCLSRPGQAGGRVTGPDLGPLGQDPAVAIEAPQAL